MDLTKQKKITHTINQLRLEASGKLAWCISNLKVWVKIPAVQNA